MARAFAKQPGQNLRLRPWLPGDQDAFEMRPDFARESEISAWDWSKGAPGPTWTLERWNGEVMGVGGGIERDGLFVGWARLAQLANRDWPRALWCASKVLAFLARGPGPDRVVATASQDVAGAARCLERLGFEWRDSVAVGGVIYRVMEWGS